MKYPTVSPPNPVQPSPPPDEAAEGEPHESHPGPRLVSGFPQTVESGANRERLPLILLVLQNGALWRSQKAHFLLPLPQTGVPVLPFRAKQRFLI